MSQITAIFGTDNDKEILNSLSLIANVGIFICFHLAISLIAICRTPLALASSTSQLTSTTALATRACCFQSVEMRGLD
jgi:hypothetical protein